MLEEEWCEMGKLVKNVEFWQFGQNRDNRGNPFIILKADRKRSTSVMNELSAIDCLKKKRIKDVIGKIK